jgi:hypothetical protein
MKSKYRLVLATAIAAFLAVMVSAGGVKAKTYNIKGSLSGTVTAVPIDISANSCAVVDTIEICTATSSLSIYGGTSFRRTCRH